VATFDSGAATAATPDLDLPDPKSVPVAPPLLVGEAKNGCTMGMLPSLDRKQRLIYTLGEILGVSDAVGGEGRPMVLPLPQLIATYFTADGRGLGTTVSKRGPVRCPCSRLRGLRCPLRSGGCSLHPTAGMGSRSLLRPQA
jgi:hypothetical protein